MWTTTDIRYLREHAGLGASELAIRMGRSPAAVKRAASRFRISLRRPGSRRGSVLGHLIYIARVDESFGRDYYGSAEFADRMDCVYEPVGAGFRWRAGRCHGPEHLVHDLGDGPDYNRAVVLASRDFRYFGREDTSDYRAQFPAVKDAVERAGRGHRVNHGEVLRKELLDLKDLVWESTGSCVVGVPDAQPSVRGASGSCRRRGGQSAKCGA